MCGDNDNDNNVDVVAVISTMAAAASTFHKRISFLRYDDMFGKYSVLLPVAIHPDSWISTTDSLAHSGKMFFCRHNNMMSMWIDGMAYCFRRMFAAHTHGSVKFVDNGTLIKALNSIIKSNRIKFYFIRQVKKYPYTFMYFVNQKFLTLLNKFQTYFTRYILSSLSYSGCLFFRKLYLKHPSYIYTR